MKFWISTAALLLVFGTVFPLLRGDGEGAAKGLIGGIGVLAIVLVFSGVNWVVRSTLATMKKLRESTRQ